MDFVIRQYQPGDEKGILQLYLSEFNQERTLKQWTWEYRNPPAKHPIIYVLSKGSEIIGHCAVIPIQAVCRGQSIFIGKAEGAMIKKEYRFIVARKGLFKEMLHRAAKEAFNADIPVLFGFTSYPRDFINAGFEAVDKLYAYEKEMSMINQTKSWLKYKLFNKGDYEKISIGDKIFNFNIHRKSNKKTGSNQLKITISSDFPEDCNIIDSHAINLKRIALERNPAFIKWRFEQNPFVRPVMITARKKEELVGWMILSVISGNTKNGLILDWQIGLEETDSIQYALLNRAKSYFKTQRVAVIRCWRSDNPADENVMKNFIRWGLRRVVHVTNFVVLYDDTRMDRSFVTNGKNWSISMALTEGRWG